MHSSGKGVVHRRPARLIPDVLPDHLAGIAHWGCIPAVTEVTVRPLRAATDCRFQRLCLQTTANPPSQSRRP
jgi:hypothetical protein